MNLLLKMLLTLTLMGNLAFAQSFGEDNDNNNDDDDDKKEDTIYYACETFTDGGTYKLYTNGFHFGLDSYDGEMEIKWENDSDYSELPRFRHGATLRKENIREGHKAGKPVFIVTSINPRTGNGVKLVLPMRAEVYGRTMGEIHINDESFEVQCMIEIDLF